MKLERILIVDDDADFAELVKLQLEKIESVKEVDILNNGVDFFKYFMAKEYSMVILDYILKDIDGLQILIEMKEKNIHLPIIMMTGQGDESVAADSFLNGAIDYLIKDFQNINLLSERVSNAFTRFSERKLKDREREILLQEKDYLNEQLAVLMAQKEKAEKELIKVREELRTLKSELDTISSFYESIISVLTFRLAEDEDQDKEHLQRVAHLSIEIAKELKLSPINIKEVYATAALHDIGGNDKNLDLLFATKLTAEQTKRIKEISETASNLISSIPGLNEVGRNVLYKFEFWNGDGNPFGLKNDQIPMTTRIVQAAETYDNLICHGLNGKKMQPKEAIKTLEEKAGIIFDPTVLVALTKVYTRTL